jgi:undecaprenyl diphosphate synthase
MADSAQLSHVLVVGGPLDEWTACSDEHWNSYLKILQGAVAGMGVRWLTVYPYEGAISVPQQSQLLDHLQSLTHGRVRDGKVIVDGELTLVIDVCGEGKDRFVQAINRLAAPAVTESEIDEAVLAPADVEPDLTIVFGKPHQLPSSLMWELAYSELVFLDIDWKLCQKDDIELAVNDYQRRDRRFGGVDS